MLQNVSRTCGHSQTFHQALNLSNFYNKRCESYVHFKVLEMTKMLKSVWKTFGVCIFMSDVYFTVEQVEILLPFPWQEWLYIERCFGSLVFNEDSSKICTGATLAPFFKRHLDIAKDFQNEKEHKGVFIAFC